MVLYGNSIGNYFFSNFADQSIIADMTTGSDVSTSDLPPGLIHSEGCVVSRGRWSEKEEFVLETGPPSMTQVCGDCVYKKYTLVIQCASTS